MELFQINLSDKDYNNFGATFSTPCSFAHLELAWPEGNRFLVAGPDRSPEHAEAAVL